MLWEGSGTHGSAGRKTSAAKVGREKGRGTELQVKLKAECIDSNNTNQRLRRGGNRVARPTQGG